MRDLSKAAQLRGLNKEPEKKFSTQEKDKAMKYIICALELAYECPEAINKKLELQDDHIKNKASHPELRYKPSNHQLVHWTRHQEKTDSGKYIDERHPDLVKFLLKFDCLFIDHR